MNLSAIQASLRQAGLDGWLFCDHHCRDIMAYRILGMDSTAMASRRWFYFIPVEGEPSKLAHRVEPHKLDDLPGIQDHFTAWVELHSKLEAILGRPGRIAMQYSSNNNIPYVDAADPGIVDLVRSFGHEVVSSADLVQEFEAVMDQEGLEMHIKAGERVQAIKDQAYALMDAALREGRPITENEVKDFILKRFEEEGMTTDGSVPIVGFNDHPADPHFEPTAENAYTLDMGDTILIDLWARIDSPEGVYYDITWCGFAGNQPPEEYVKIFRTVRDGREAAVGLIRERFAAGEPCHGYEVDDACRAVIADAGYGDLFIHRTGHSIGHEVHGNGVNIDNLETRDDRLLVPGVCFSIEPGIYIDGRMAVRSEINVFISPGGGVVVSGPEQKELIMIGYNR